MARIDVLRCTGCQRMAIAVDGRRVTNHKCGATWDVLMSEEARMPAEAEADRDALAKRVGELARLARRYDCDGTCWARTPCTCHAEHNAAVDRILGGGA